MKRKQIQSQDSLLWNNRLVFRQNQV